MTAPTHIEQSLLAVQDTLRAVQSQIDLLLAQHRAEAERAVHDIDTTQSRMLTLAEAARQLGFSPTKARRLVLAGNFPVPVHTIGARRVVSKVQLEQYLAGEDVGRAAS